VGNLKRSWKTTLAGVLGLISAGAAIAQDPTKAADPVVIGGILTSIGVLLAKDADVSGPAPTK